MDHNDHRIPLAGLNLLWRKKPSLNAKFFVSPLKIQCFAPGRSLSAIVAGQRAPFPDRSSPDLGRRFKAAAGGGRDFAILGDSKVREVAEGVDTFCALPDCP